MMPEKGGWGVEKGHRKRKRGPEKGGDLNLGVWRESEIDTPNPKQCCIVYTF